MPNGHSQFRESIIAHLDPKSPVSEAFRTLRTNLQFSGLDKELRSVLITSAGPGEGKSTVSSNLAVAMAQAGKRVILVDSDLRRPTVHNRFGIDNAQGVTTAIMNGFRADMLSRCEIENLSLLPSGPIPPNPSEMLASGAMKRLVSALSEQADMVIYDCPPVIAVTDAAVLAPYVDGVLLVVRLGVAQRDMTVRAKELLTNVKANLLGAVVNGISSDSGYGYYYYYYYYDHQNDAEAEAASTAE